MKKSTRKILDMTANWLLVVGGLNWGLSLFDWNLVQSIADFTMPIVGTLVYSVVGISSLWVGVRMATNKFLK